ncbi:putative F-box protein [Iris pallida]|uniref:F-box protein n=1 Tax=Iris pallida TaxID=29817 RepID=A0AAX6FQ70_IRIPA|nr:putative F-box protein [Iris pallida]
MSGTAVVDCVIDEDEEWVSSLRRRVEAVELRRRHGRDAVPRTIFRVPANIREGDPGAYDPRIISFGPFHRADPALQSTSRLKLRYLQKLLLRNRDASLEDYIGLIRGLEARARASYSEDIDMDSNAFVEMLLLDAGFIVEILLMQTDAYSYDDDEEEEEEEDDPVVTTNWTLPLIEYDMLMLENQIPYFVTEGVFELAARAAGSSLTELLLAFFDDLLPCGRTTAPSEEEAAPKFYHVLHFLHSCIMPEQQQQQQARSKNKRSYNPLIYLKLHRVGRMSSNLYRRVLSSLSARSAGSSVSVPPLLLTPESIPSAVSLKEAGVEFEERKSDSFLDVAFRDGTMGIPALRVGHQTGSLFRNLIALEQCLPEVGTHVATYALLMDCLVDTGEDVALLHRRGCIVNGLGSGEEAALLFNRLCKEVTVEYGSCYLAGLFKDVGRHCGSRWNKWRAKLMHDYFSNPWAVLSLAGAVVLIFLTVVQTFLAVLSYFKPPS